MTHAPANKIRICGKCRIEGYFEGTQCVACARFAWQVEHSFTGQHDEIIPKMLLSKLGSLLFELEDFVCKHGLVKTCRRVPKRDEAAKRGDHLVSHWLMVNTREEKFLEDTVSKEADEICFGETNWGAKEPHMYFKCTRVLAYEARRILTDYIKWQEANTDSTNIPRSSGTVSIEVSNYEAKLQIPKKCTETKPIQKATSAAEPVINAKIMDVEDITAECDPLMQQAIYLSSSSKVQEALNSLANAFNICVTKARTLEKLQEWVNLDDRLNQEETVMCKHLTNIIQQGFVPLEALAGL